jgi:hypothetical protein
MRSPGFAAACWLLGEQVTTSMSALTITSAQESSPMEWPVLGGASVVPVARVGWISHVGAGYTAR